MQDNSDRQEPLARYMGDAALVGARAADFVPRADLTYRVIEGVTVRKRDAHFSLFTGSIFRNCKFESVQFTRCDLDGMRIERCHFEECSFEGAEIRSTTLAKCDFVHCSFNTVHILDSTFVDCRFDHSPMESANISQSLFNRGVLLSSSLSRASCTLTTYTGVRFQHMTLGDCTFLYNILDHCEYEAVRFDVECVGMVYGLSRKDLLQMGFLYLGEAQEVPPEGDLVQHLVDLYSRRNWSVGLLVMRLNFQITSRVYAIREYFRVLSERLRAGQVLKTDELQFIANIFFDLQVNHRLPFLNVVELLELADALIAEDPMTRDDPRTRASLVRFANTLSGILKEMLHDFEDHRIQIEALQDRPVELEATFDVRPDLDVAELLNAAADYSRLPVLHRSRTIQTFKGSFVAIVGTTLFTVLSLQILLFLINGCLIQATELKARFRALTGDRLPAHYRSVALSSKQEIPEYLVTPFRQLLGYASQLPWLADPQLKGFTPENLLKLQMSTLEEERSSSEVAE